MELRAKIKQMNEEEEEQQPSLKEGDDECIANPGLLPWIDRYTHTLYFTFFFLT
jgi:hypothetical protein